MFTDEGRGKHVGDDGESDGAENAWSLHDNIDNQTLHQKSAVRDVV